MATRWWKNFEYIFIRFGATHERDRRTDRQTDRQTDTACRHISRLCIASRGKNPKIGQVWRPVAPQPYVTQKSRPNPGNSLALGLQRGVNSICLQCIPWLVACSERSAWLTDFDRSSTFRFSGSGIRTMMRIGLKSWPVRPCPDTCRHAKFYPNPRTRFWAILLTDRQTDRQTNKHRGRSHIPPPLSEVIMSQSALRYDRGNIIVVKNAKEIIRRCKSVI